MCPNKRIILGMVLEEESKCQKRLLIQTKRNRSIMKKESKCRRRDLYRLSWDLEVDGSPPAPLPPATKPTTDE